MSTIAQVAGVLAVIGGGVFLVTYYFPTIQPGSREKYADCVDDGNCKGGTLFGAETRCNDGKCTPQAVEDTIFNIKWAPKGQSIKNYCGRYNLQGEGGKCSQDSQCSYDGIQRDLANPNAKFATPTSLYYCNSLGRCDSKGKDWLGIYWKRQDVPDPSKLDYSRTDKKYENMDEVLRMYTRLGKDECREELKRDYFPNWAWDGEGGKMSDFVQKYPLEKK